MPLRYAAGRRAAIGWYDPRVRASFVGTVLLVAYAYCWGWALIRLSASYPPLVAYALSVAPGLIALALILARFQWQRRRERRRRIDEEWRR